MQVWPQIYVTLDDNRQLAALMDQALRDGRFDAVGWLGHELNRAHLVPAETVPGDCVTLDARARYCDEASGAVHEATLVSSLHGHIAGAVSVLSETGTALLGLSAGQRIVWRSARGAIRSLRLLDVLFQPERAALGGR